ncbi:hypothetical protein BDFB_012969, partial [Asbolus verrucosus]
MRRLNKRPSALLVDESPFKKLHLNLKYYKPSYESTTKEKKKNLPLCNRLIYKPIFNIGDSFSRQNCYAVTMGRDYIQARWEGQEFDSGEAVNWEHCQFVNRGMYHDGPVINLDYSAVTDTILS